MCLLESCDAFLYGVVGFEGVGLGNSDGDREGERLWEIGRVVDSLVGGELSFVWVLK